MMTKNPHNSESRKTVKDQVKSDIHVDLGTLAERIKTPQGPWTDLALHTLGWKAFQDLCAHVCREIFSRPVEVYREANDGGRDAILKSKIGDPGAQEVTVQCKFSSDATKTFRASSLTREEATIRKLVEAGDAQEYAILTSMSVSGSDAKAIKARLVELGVVKPYVFGREFLISAIKQSARLRALVPRVYGLGDLSTILDERSAAQTRRLLGHMLPTLKVYVPTAPHVAAVRKLAEHRLVLLLGDPATGKSTIAALLATTAAEDPNHDCFKADGPEELLRNWNPNENGGQFYWIDDAFGPNQLREDFVDRWIQIIQKVQAAMADGNRFVLTSRRHIYEAAKAKLGSRNFWALQDGKAIVDVGALTIDERRQILYNHVKAGTQPRQWKAKAKQFLEDCAQERTFLPEIARRFADPTFTKTLTLQRENILRFFREPQEHLIQTLREMSSAHQACVTLVFLHRGRMPVGNADTTMSEIVQRHFGIEAASLANGILHLKNSFLVEQEDAEGRFLTFKHPTIADAVSGMLVQMEGMTELYLRGTKVLTLLSSVVCTGMDPVRDAVRVPEHLNNILAERIAQTPDGPDANRLLFAFLAERASDALFKLVVRDNPGMLERAAYGYSKDAYDPKVQTCARAFQLGVLPPAVRDEVSARLDDALLGGDTSFLEMDDVLALFKPTRLLKLPSLIRTRYLEEIDEHIGHVIDEADIDADAADQFGDLSSTLDDLRRFFDDDKEMQASLLTADEMVSEGIGRLEERQNEANEERERERERDRDEYWNWDNSAPATPVTRTADLAISDSPRSIFSDVDD